MTKLILINTACLFLVMLPRLSVPAALPAPSPLQAPPLQQPPSKPRYIRSCGNQVLHTILNACNKNHKRSPIVMNFIFVEYYVPQRPGETPSNNNVGGHSGSDSGIASFLPPWIWDNEEILLVMSFSDDDMVMDSDPGEQMKESNNPGTASAIPRELPRGKRSAYMHSIMEKCCTSGCTSIDFLGFC